jgi:hypothetical protein
MLAAVVNASEVVLETFAVVASLEVVLASLHVAAVNAEAVLEALAVVVADLELALATLRAVATELDVALVYATAAVCVATAGADPPDETNTSVPPLLTIKPLTVAPA